MRSERSKATEELGLEKCTERDDVEIQMVDYTKHLEDETQNKVDDQVLKTKKKRLGSKPKITEHEVDEFLIKALRNLASAVEDCLGYEAKISQLNKRIVSLQATRAVRVKKEQDLFSERVKKEVQDRTTQRRRFLEKGQQKSVEKKVKQYAHDEAREKRIERKELERKTLQISEHMFREKDRMVEEIQNEEMRAKNLRFAETQRKKKIKRQESIRESMLGIREYMQLLDNQTDAYIHRKHK